MTDASRPVRARPRPAERVVALLAACHPGPTVVVTTLCTALAAAVGAPAGTVALVLAVVLAGQLSIGWSNDWVDAARDRAVGRRDKPVVTGAVSPALLRAAAFAALALAVCLSLLAGPAAAAAHAAVVAMGWAYNVGLKSTVASGVPYAVAFGALPAFVVLARPGDGLPAGWLVAVGALLGVGAHLVNVLPDLEDDAGTGVRGLPHRLGRRATAVLAPGVLAAAVVVAVLGPPGPPRVVPAALGVGAVAVAVTAGVVGAARPASRAPFTLAMLVAGLCVLVLVVTGADGALT
ncbi:UbiA prenyltransferase [Cellulomonas flavigena DSM 20109]|uniref:UbiA prenyltransferase n=1 Tax=Cellulomonas flavigena (strain ATCC 482 / DSM 20109 / BCRC 11376 / JCM 18109 / NBRC 3775 / NCIMB 8073 / NRS 134) TaxID=446466 RepID=D5ULM3_CELFN|nr:UbiA family prenyltransferase [Cellulomonas flavigena]ADG74065.1 UbiA prenyltransferase [Cellulomonas flavigena DSM 20109]